MANHHKKKKERKKRGKDRYITKMKTKVNKFFVVLVTRKILKDSIHKELF